jgi:metal-sulfur cluster biosynthetic enzyme
MGAETIIDRKAEVWARLQTVTDPELDEPVTDLEFVTRADVDDENRVHIEFRLPTYWCAANFSFLMADDMRLAVKQLPWVSAVEVVLGEHMYAEKINAGLAQGLSFRDTFGAEADGDLEDLRRTFLVKAFQRRQAALLVHLMGLDYDAAAIVELKLGELVTAEIDEAGARLIARYCERRSVIASAEPEARAFIDADGDPLQVETLPAYVRVLRRVGVNAEFNSALCRGLLHARFDMDTAPAARPSAQVAAPPQVPAQAPL